MKDDSKARVDAYRLCLKTNRVKYTNIKLRDMLRKREERASEHEKMSELSELEGENDLVKKEGKTTERVSLLLLGLT